MNTDYRYQLESRRLTGHQPRKLTCPHCGRKKCFVRYVDTQNQFQYVADTDMADLLTGEAVLKA